MALANAARSANDKPPIGFLDPILYKPGGLGASAYNDVGPMDYGTALQTFAGSDVGIGTVDKSVGAASGRLMGNQPRLPLVNVAQPMGRAPPSIRVSLLMSATERHPARPIVSSKSALRFWITSRTPSRPPSARP